MFSMFIRPEVLKKIREDFPEGATVEVVEFHDQYRDVPAGTRGHSPDRTAFETHRPC